MEYVIRFLAGGVIVSAFSVLGDVLRPKSFAGLFGAAPSVALATMSLAFMKEGAGYVSIEGRSMVVGAAALAVYAVVVCHLMMRWRLPAWIATALALLPWFAFAFGVEHLWLG